MYKYICRINSQQWMARLKVLYSFSVAAVTNYHKLGSYSQQECILLQLWRSEIQNQFHRVKVKVFGQDWPL